MNIKSHNPFLKKQISRLISELFINSADSHLTEIVVDRLLWTATEDSDEYERVKYLGQPYWSKNAIIQYRAQNNGRKTKNFKDLRHEHLVPRNLIKKYIYALADKTTENIYKILDKYSHAVVVTKAEDLSLKNIGLNEKMPESFYENGDILARYAETVKWSTNSGQLFIKCLIFLFRR
jgi:hypothetical protein